MYLLEEVLEKASFGALSPRREEPVPRDAGSVIFILTLIEICSNNTLGQEAFHDNNQFHENGLRIFSPKQKLLL